VVVSKLGTAVIHIDELNQQTQQNSRPVAIYTETQLKTIITKAQSESLTVVMTNGCFDILHPGHIDYLEKARALGDMLFVAVNDDESVKRLKGEKRPINSLQSRMKMLSALACVTGVVSFSDDTPESLYCHLLPDVLVKGGDWPVEKIVGYREVMDWGGQVHSIPFIHQTSTTALLVGTGDIGSHIAAAFTALGITVTGVSRTGQASHPAFRAVHTVDRLADLVADADWIVLSVPDTPVSRGLVSRAVLERCRGAVLLNAGRGAVVDEAALPDALDNGWLRAAALDVFTTEPLPSTSPLWGHPRVLVSPHISGLTTVAGAAEGFLACAESLGRGVWPTWVVDRARGY
jgi:rfaE bifunctional protein nucleotidyltransferase chain/domain